MAACNDAALLPFTVLFAERFMPQPIRMYS
jgi:hypothetical protein